MNFWGLHYWRRFLPGWPSESEVIRGRLVPISRLIEHGLVWAFEQKHDSMSFFGTFRGKNGRRRSAWHCRRFTRRKTSAKTRRPSREQAASVKRRIKRMSFQRGERERETRERSPKASLGVPFLLDFASFLPVRSSFAEIICPALLSSVAPHLRVRLSCGSWFLLTLPEDTVIRRASANQIARWLLFTNNPFRCCYTRKDFSETDG